MSGIPPPDVMPDGSPVPEGEDFLQLIWGLEDATEQKIDAALPAMGDKAPDALRELGTTLSFLDRLASCWWGCPGGDHAFEFLVGRGANWSRAGLRLMRLGFYDEALGAARNAGEVGNLLFLFISDEDAFEEWRTGNPWWSFRPKQVRERLGALGDPPPISEERYGALSAGIHPSPSEPQAHNELGRALLAGRFQMIGALISLNELALATASIAAGAAIISPLDKPRRSQIFSVGRRLAAAIGGANIVEIAEYYEKVRSDPGFAAFEKASRGVGPKGLGP